MRKRIVIVLVLFGISLFALAAYANDEALVSQATGNVARIEGVTIGGGLSRFVDAEAGVACWIYLKGVGATMSCLPLGETTLGAK